MEYTMNAGAATFGSGRTPSAWKAEAGLPLHPGEVFSVSHRVSALFYRGALVFCCSPAETPRALTRAVYGGTMGC
ncbi:MAG: hypothetical protein ACLU8J_11790 [Acutalibacter sp.]